MLVRDSHWSRQMLKVHLIHVNGPESLVFEVHFAFFTPYIARLGTSLFMLLFVPFLHKFLAAVSAMEFSFGCVHLLVIQIVIGICELFLTSFL